MSDRGEKVFILGAGFTKAFLPNAPLLIDDYQVEHLLKKFSGFPELIHILESDQKRNKNGKINLERLMTRLDGRMPYDDPANDELGVLLSYLKRVFIWRLNKAKNGPYYDEELSALANYCIRDSVHCITFNYDDLFDEALAKSTPIDHQTSKPHWNPTTGYGFFCKPSITSIGQDNFFWKAPAMWFLKLHGSVNWRIRLGTNKPCSIESIVHHEEWLPERSKLYQKEKFTFDLNAASIHLESDPFIVPPVLNKSALMQEPILRLVWAWAKNLLNDAKEVTFVGYSMPITDIAAGFLFSEALEQLPTSKVKVVSFAQSKETKESLKQAYRNLFPRIADPQFDFRGARKWAQELVKGNINSKNRTD